MSISKVLGRALQIGWRVVRAALLSLALFLGLLVVAYAAWMLWWLNVGYYRLTYYLPNGMHFRRTYHPENETITTDLFRTSDDKLLERGLEWVCFNAHSISGNIYTTPEMESRWAKHGYAAENVFVYLTPNSERPATEAAYEAAMREAGMWASSRNCYCHKNFGPELFLDLIQLELAERRCGPSGGRLD